MRWLLGGILLLFSCTSTVHYSTVLDQPTPLTIRMMPAMLIAGIETRVTCQLPTDLEGEGTFHFAVIPLFSEQGPIDKLQYTRTFIAPCQPVTVVCGYTPAGKSKPVLITQNYTPTNEECK